MFRTQILGCNKNGVSNQFHVMFRLGLSFNNSLSDEGVPYSTFQCDVSPTSTFLVTPVELLLEGVDVRLLKYQFYYNRH